MNLFELLVKIGVDDQASKKIADISGKLGNGLKTAAKVGTAAVGAASAAIVALGKIGLDYNKQMETYTTNFEVMMGDAEAAAKKVEELKEMGARTPFELGDLANATQTLLAFNVAADDSTGVLQKLGDISLGNVQKLESLTRAYGKMNASQKVTLEDINMMIDAGFNPLLIVAEETGKAMTEVYDDISKGKVSFEQIEDAISKATSAGGQFYQGMQKASQTVEGLISTLKDNATALVGEVYMPISEGLQKTVLPSAIDAINTLSEAFKENGVEGMIAAAGEMLGSLVSSIAEYAPKVVDAAVSLVESLIQGLSENQESIATGAVQIVTTLATGILEMLPQIIQLGLDLIVSLANGISQNLGTLIPTIVDVILQIVDTLTDPAQLNLILNAGLELLLGLVQGLVDAAPSLIDAAFTIIDNLVQFILDGENLTAVIEASLEIIMALMEGLVQAIPQLVEAATQIIVKLCEFILDPENIGMLIDMAFQIVVAIVEGLISAAVELIKGAAELVKSIIDVFEDTDWGALGESIIDGLLSGIVSAWGSLSAWVSNAWNDLIGGISSTFGIGPAASLEGKLSKASNAVRNQVQASGMSGKMSIATASANGKSGKGGTGMTIIQNIHAVPQTPAELASATSAYFEQARWTR